MKKKLFWKRLFWFGLSLIAIALISRIGQVEATKAPELLVETDDRVSVLKNKNLGIVRTTEKAIVDQRVITFADSPAQVITWKEVDERGGEVPFYSISLDGTKIDTVQETSYDIQLKYGNFDPARGVPELPEVFKTRNANDETAVYIVQFVTQPIDEYHNELRQLGAKDLMYLANHSNLVMMNSTTKSRVESLPYVRWVGRYEPAYKLKATLRERILADVNSIEPARFNIMVLKRGEEFQNKIAENVNNLGGRVENIIPEGFRMEATLNGSQLLSIANENEILFIDRWGAPETDMSLVRSTGGADFIQTTLGFTGQGVRGEVMDSGILLTHTDFNSGLPVLQHGSNNVTSHGTATYGINFGRGTSNSAARGMLPEAQGIFADYDFLTNRYTHTAQLKQSPYYAVFQSNSWGSPWTTDYTTISAEMDDILFLNDIVILNSQSNTGNQNSRPQAWAKNIVSVGGIKHFNTASFTDDRWQNGASVGPAGDNRIKPDLAHFWDDIHTTTSTSNTAYTTTFGGTSAATPITAGHFGIFFQMWHNGIFGNPTGATVFDSAPHMTTSKAIMINTAVQWSMTTPSDATRFRQGWGRADLQNLYNLRNKMFIIDETDAITNLQTKTYTVASNGTEPLKVTMVYADPMGNPSSSIDRINDLTLKVTAPNGTVYWGNNGLTTGLWSTSGGVANTIDTVENVYVQSPQAGNWTVQVIASQINQDAKLETGGVDADFALVASGIQKPNIVVNPTSLSFNSPPCTSPIPKNLTISSSGAPLNWTITPNQNWIYANPGSGTTTSNINVGVTSGTLASNPGTYFGSVTITAPNAANSPLTVPVTWTVNPGSQLIVNGGFETTISPWVLGGGAAHDTVAANARTGSGSLREGGVNNAAHTAYQTINVPFCPNPSLRFYLKVTTSETGLLANDRFYVEVQNSAGVTLATLNTASNLNQGPNYVLRGPFSLAPYAGQTIRLRFRTATNATLPTTFRVDDVSVQ
jgi:serine protease AprX